MCFLRMCGGQESPDIVDEASALACPGIGGVCSVYDLITCITLNNYRGKAEGRDMHIFLLF